MANIIIKLIEILNMTYIHIPFTKVITGSDSEVVKWVYFSFVILLISACVFFAHQAVKKTNKITNSKNNYSYSKISVLILRIVILNLCVIMTGLVM